MNEYLDRSFIIMQVNKLIWSGVQYRSKLMIQLRDLTSPSIWICLTGQSRVFPHTVSLKDAISRAGLTAKREKSDFRWVCSCKRRRRNIKHSRGSECSTSCMRRLFAYDIKVPRELFSNHCFSSLSRYLISYGDQSVQCRMMSKTPNKVRSY